MNDEAFEFDTHWYYDPQLDEAAKERYRQDESLAEVIVNSIAASWEELRLRLEQPGAERYGGSIFGGQLQDYYQHYSPGAEPVWVLTALSCDSERLYQANVYLGRYPVIERKQEELLSSAKKQGVSLLRTNRA